MRRQLILLALLGPGLVQAGTMLLPMKSAETEAHSAYAKPAKPPAQEDKGNARILTDAERAELRRQLYQFSGRKGQSK